MEGKAQGERGCTMKGKKGFIENETEERGDAEIEGRGD